MARAINASSSEAAMGEAHDVPAVLTAGEGAWCVPHPQLHVCFARISRIEKYIKMYAVTIPATKIYRFSMRVLQIAGLKT